MIWIRLFVSLKVTDNIGRTALQTVRSRLGHPEVSGLHRSEFWEWTFNRHDGDTARDQVDSLVARTALFANPTKHRWVTESHKAPVTDDKGYSSPFGGHAGILVRDREDGQAESTFAALSRFVPASEIPSTLTRGTWWDLTFENPSAVSVADVANDLAVTTSRTQGIFCNPHYQNHTLILPHG